jgi:hypothetical protein
MCPISNLPFYDYFFFCCCRFRHGRRRSLRYDCHKKAFLAFFALNLAATAVNAMGICFGGYPGWEFLHYFSFKSSQIYLSPEKPCHKKWAILKKLEFLNDKIYRCRKKKVIWYFSKIGVWVNFIHSKIEVLQNCPVSLVRGKSKRIERKSNPQIPNPSLLWKWLKHLWTILCFLFEVFLWSGRIYIQQKVFPTRFNQRLNFQKNRKDKKLFYVQWT